MSTVICLSTGLTQASEVCLTIPANVNKELFREGFEHGMRSNQLTNFKASYRAGFREAKCYLRELRRREGILTLPMKAKLTAVSR